MSATVALVATKNVSAELVPSVKSLLTSLRSSVKRETTVIRAVSCGETAVPLPIGMEALTPDASFCNKRPVGLNVSMSTVSEKVIVRFPLSREKSNPVIVGATFVHIHHLRKKLPEAFIKTIRGVGYSVKASPSIGP